MIIKSKVPVYELTHELWVQIREKAEQELELSGEYMVIISFLGYETVIVGDYEAIYAIFRAEEVCR